MPTMNESFQDQIDAKYHKMVENIRNLEEMNWDKISIGDRKKHEADLKALQDANATMEESYEAWKKSQKQEPDRLTDLTDSLAETQSIFDRLTKRIKENSPDWPVIESLDKNPDAPNRFRRKSL